MNSRIILAVITIAVLSSCSTAYKAQTPDDVYYSPARPQEEYVRVETEKERNEYREEEYSDDRWLRWKVRNRTRWSGFDEYAYDMYDYRYGYNNSYTWYKPNYLNNYWSWNYGYNPYCGRVIVVNPKYTPAYNQVVRTYRPGTYNTTFNNSNNNNSKIRTTPGVYRPAGSYNNSNSNSGSLGNSIKKVFNNSNSSNNSSNSDSKPTRTYTPPSNNSSNTNSSGSGSSGGSSGGSGGGVTRPSRGG